MKRAEIDRILTGWAPDEVVARLSEYLTEHRRDRIEQVLAGRMFGVHVAIEEPYDPHNAGAVVRSAEAFGAGCVHVIGAHARVLRGKRTTTGTWHWVETLHYAGLEEFYARMRADGMLVAAACVEATTPLEQLPVDRPICLLLGNESRGLTDAAREQADMQYAVPIQGFAESLNLSVCAAVSLYSLTNRRRAALGRPGDGEAAQLMLERARWYVRSVDDRFARALLDQSNPAPSRAGGEE